MWLRGPLCWSGVWERNSQVLPTVHLRKQLIKLEITHQEQHSWRAGPEGRATLDLGQEINRLLPRLSGVTVVSAAVIVLLNRRRKRPIRLRLENNLRVALVPGQERWSKSEGKKEEGDSRRDKQRGEQWGDGSKARCAWPLPSSSSSESQ